MNFQQTTATTRAGVDWRRAEFLLVGLGFLGFITLPIRMTTIYGGLPAHPLFIHVPVVLIPVTIVGALPLHGQASRLISEHSQAAHILAIVYVAFTAALILAFASMRISSGRPTG